jgi:hypothetical protein
MEDRLARLFSGNSVKSTSTRSLPPPLLPADLLADPVGPEEDTEEEEEELMLLLVLWQLLLCLFVLSLVVVVPWST